MGLGGEGGGLGMGLDFIPKYRDGLWGWALIMRGWIGDGDEFRTQARGWVGDGDSVGR